MGMVKGCGCFLFLAVVAGGGVTAFSWWSGNQRHKEFLKAVGTGDPAALRTLLHDDLKREVDDPVLAVWMGKVRAALGEAVEARLQDLVSPANVWSFLVRGRLQGAVKTTRGEAEVTLEFAGGKLRRFALESPQVPAEWFDGPATMTLYRERGKELLTFLLTGQVDKAFAMMAENRQADKARIRGVMENIARGAGGLKSVAFVADRYAQKPRPALETSYEVVCDRGSTVAKVFFLFEPDRYRAVIDGFDVAFPEPPK